MTSEEYNKEIEHIYSQFPSFQVIGSRAFKPGLEGMQRIMSQLKNPQKEFRSIHIAGTNGKGSVSSMIASGIMPFVKKVGLYTSPHLTDFRERIKINGKMIPKRYVYDFLVSNKSLFEKEKASFFEITTAMAFCYFASEKVDFAVIECGLGGRLDSTNIIIPEVSIITNIGKDHCQFLGETHGEIAYEKAGIIKQNIPVILGECGNPEPEYIKDGHNEKPIICNKIVETIINRVVECGSGFFIAEDIDRMLKNDVAFIYKTAKSILSKISIEKMDLKGIYQNKNVKTAAIALALILTTEEYFKCDKEKAIKKVADAFINAAKITQLRGRWEKLHLKTDKDILVICDTGHNAHGFAALKEQIESTHTQRGGNLKIVFGVVADKDLEAISHLLPKDAEYIAVKAKGERALDSNILKDKLSEFKLKCNKSFPSVEEGIKYTIKHSDNKDFVYIGGSTFVVAEALESNIFCKEK